MDVSDKNLLNPVADKWIQSPVGVLHVKASQYGISHLGVAKEGAQLLGNASGVECEAAQLHLALLEQELAEYFSGSRDSFTVPLAPRGTVFQIQVWQALIELTYGSTCSYGDIAQQIGRPKAVRAVGAANGANPIAIIVPCHRVIGKNGQLTGYAYGLSMKQRLLTLEYENSAIA
ncbi:methylated-DNA--[protein]-cysteine S-methyltransferase [Shewanella sp. VB17]|uniref:methylated-DNA--[protein]-cysteine S-methyltransferase n=1 Tax=Shewanella sp. VB17 TaxID=2739432 RepID=UPI0015679DF6|nr:methylated-DNA--[protein]-cysteine S-methyltransferase [Shewanella sp. VB17]NRD74642.1 methylated-DNA--[protein]-cysteine S-methyltransferase [Shewanella sp. VB17]